MLEMRVLSVQSEIKLQVHVLESNYMYHKKFGTCTLVGTCSLFDLSLTVLSYESPKVHVVWVKKAQFWLYILNNSRWVKPLAELVTGPARYHPWAQLSPPTLGQTLSD